MGVDATTSHPGMQCRCGHAESSRCTGCDLQCIRAGHRGSAVAGRVHRSFALSSTATDPAGDTGLAVDTPPLRQRMADPEGMTALRMRCAAAIAVAAALLAVPAAAAAAPDPESRIETAEVWIWPVPGGVRVVQPYAAPAHDYGPGHRGIDVAAPAGSDALSPASGTVAFSGTVVDRPLLTIDHGGGLVTTLEPVSSDLSPGDAVARGDVVGTVTTGGHSAPGSLHFGVRLDGEYINPLLLLGGIPRAVLLPCC